VILSIFNSRRDRLAKDAAREFLWLHRFIKEETLDQIEAQFARGDKVSSRFHAFGDGARSQSVGKLQDTPANRLLQAVVAGSACSALRAKQSTSS
jgi:hypothetical protein